MLAENALKRRSKMLDSLGISGTFSAASSEAVPAVSYFDGPVIADGGVPKLQSFCR